MGRARLNQPTYIKYKGEEYVLLTEAVKDYGICRSSLNVAIKDGRIGYIKYEHRVFCKVSSLESFRAGGSIELDGDVEVMRTSLI